MWDYKSTALWGGGEIGDIDPNAIGVSNELQERIREWKNKRNSYVNWEYPPDSPEIPVSVKNELDTDGADIVKALNEELGDKYYFVYESMFIK